MKKSNITFLYIIIGLLFLIIILREIDNDININIIKDKVSEKIDETDKELTEIKEKIIEPKKYYDSRYYPRKAMRINVPTRGEPPDYQQIGILTDSNNPENIKPLYGRQTYRGSNQWNYFTSLDSHLATKIPIYTGDKDCTDERGCQEINKNDMLNIGDPGKQYKANIYKNHVPRYIPYV